MSELIPPELPVLPLRNAVLFPGGRLPVRIGNPKTLRLAREAPDRMCVVVAQRSVETAEPGPSDLFSMGTAAKIVEEKWSENEASLLLETVTTGRVRLDAFVATEPYLRAKVTLLADSVDSQNDEEWLRRLRSGGYAALAADLSLNRQIKELVDQILKPLHLADLLAANLLVTVAERQRILETLDPKERVERVLWHLDQIVAHPLLRQLDVGEKWHRLWRSVLGLFD